MKCNNRNCFNPTPSDCIPFCDHCCKYNRKVTEKRLKEIIHGLSKQEIEALR